MCVAPFLFLYLSFSFFHVLAIDFIRFSFLFPIEFYTRCVNRCAAQNKNSQNDGQMCVKRNAVGAVAKNKSAQTCSKHR